mmetsp:Transcript_11915/g.48026  ORF Transcript_11915/g.48026 Transcript_11915/m.48026 type:complete len:192 (+) Transcript_11915:138-713(+)
MLEPINAKNSRETQANFAKQQSGYHFDARQVARAARVEEAAHAPESATAFAVEHKIKKPKASAVAVRHAGGKTWRDDTLDQWPEGDFRLFVGNIGNEVTDELLSHAFGRYPSLARAKVIRNKHTNKTKGYAFISFMDPFDCAKALREMNGRYIGNRPCKLVKSTWNDRTLKVVRKKEKKKAKEQKSWGITA